MAYHISKFSYFKKKFEPNIRNYTDVWDYTRAYNRAVAMAGRMFSNPGTYEKIQKNYVSKRQKLFGYKPMTKTISVTKKTL